MREYYYIDSNGAKQGPFDLETMQTMGIEKQYKGLVYWSGKLD